MASTAPRGTVDAVIVLEVLSTVLLVIGYFGAWAGAIIAALGALLGLPWSEGRRWYGRRQRDLWRAWRAGEVDFHEFKVGSRATWVRPACRSLLITVPCFAAGIALGLISGTVTWAG